VHVHQVQGPIMAAGLVSIDVEDSLAAILAAILAMALEEWRRRRERRRQRRGETRLPLPDESRG